MMTLFSVRLQNLQKNFSEIAKNVISSLQSLEENRLNMSYAICNCNKHIQCSVMRRDG